MRRALFLTLIITLLSFGTAAKAHADFKDDFVKPYGLVVHAGNRSREVSEAKAAEVLYKYFGKTTEERKADCKARKISCAARPVNHRTFVTWYFQLKNEKNPKALEVKYPKIKHESRRAWIEARRLNLIQGNMLTYSTLKDFLYRAEVVKTFEGKMYYPGLVLNLEEISKKNFRKPNEITQILKNLEQDIEKLEAEKFSNKTETLIQTLKAYKAEFKTVALELKADNHPLVKIQGMPEDLQAKVASLNIQEVLSEFTYDYSQNAPYRQHNLKTGTMQLSGKVLQPGEVLDFLKVLAEGGWWKYKYGWIIEGGKEVWAFGGGLCGASTMFFIPSYLAGLEVVQRTGHTVFYKSLYPAEYIGLEAAVFRPNKTVKVKNNTQSPLMFYAHDNPEEKKLTLYVLGNSPYSEVHFSGPIQLDKKTYKWVRQMEKTDGTIVTEELMTRYNAIR